MSPSEEVLFRDGLGDRLLIRDHQGRPTHESLLIRSDLTSIPSFEFALNERIWLVERFDHPSFLTVRNIVRVPGRLTTISLLHDQVGGTRLSELLVRAQATGLPVAAAAWFVLKEVLDGLAELHRQSGDLAHGALAPERIVLADGRVLIADYVFGSAIEQLRFTPERYWKELRVAASKAAGGVRLDRPADVAQAAMIAVAMLAGRPLRDTELPGGLGEVLTSISMPQPLRVWLLRALHMDTRRVFVHAGEASRALDEALNEAGIRPRRKDVEPFGGGRPGAPMTRPPAAIGPPSSIGPPPPISPTALLPPVVSAPRLAPLVTRPAAKTRREAWPEQGVDSRLFAQQGHTMVRRRTGVSEGFRKFIWGAALALLMACAFTAAQFVQPPEWLFSNTGTLVIESNPQGVTVNINGKAHGVTPLTLKVEAGIHEVELHGPGKPKIFKVHVTRGDRVAQFIEFFRR